MTVYKYTLYLILIILTAYMHPLFGINTSNDTVVLLHGLGRTKKSMSSLEKTLKKNGYHVINLNYPSKKHTIKTLVDTYLKPVIDTIPPDQTIHFVTHSMGGILVRYYLNEYPLSSCGHIVQIAPPNHGSELVDHLGKYAFFQNVMGPAFQELSTQNQSVPNQLPIPSYSIGIIIGTASLNPYFSYLIPGEDDGKVSTKSALLPNKPFTTVNSSHSFIMKHTIVKQQVMHFLQSGTFKK